MSQVLIVDDEPQVRDLTRRALEGQSLVCDTANDGDEALRRCLATRYETVVTDLRMPHRHGHSLAVELLDQPAPPSVVVVTGLVEPRLARDLLGRGVSEIFHKPVDYQILAQRIAGLVGEHRRPAEAPPDPQEQLRAIEESLSELTDLFAEALGPVFENELSLSAPPKSAYDLIKRDAENAEAEACPLEAHKRRSKVRAQCYGTAVVAPITGGYRPDGEPFRAAIRDVSEGGMRLLHTRAVNSEVVAVEWDAESDFGKKLRVAAEVRRCEPQGRFYNLGLQFLTAV